MTIGGGAGSAGIDPDRVAELLVDRGEPAPGRRGSGYRVTATAVMTAAHVVRDAARVRVRFNADRPGEWMTEGTVAWSDPTVDAAVITITPRPQGGGPVVPTGFGRVADRDAVLASSAMGFPRFKLRDDSTQPADDGSPSQYRDSHHAVGTIAVLSNRREGTLEVSVSPPERDPDPQRSPWEGMSGAALFNGGRIIGLVAEHHRADGLGRLAASRVDRWYERLAAERLEQLRALVPGLPAHAAGLIEVVPPTAGEVLEAGYLAQVRDIAPERLVGREEELEELVQFCAGDEPYQWWQAEPWAGKSALAAWFVLHPPAGVQIVSFFVTGRLAGQADSDAFTEAMVEQLAALMGESVPRPPSPGGWVRERLRLLDLAAARIGGRRERLVLVIDGLDEDQSARSDSNKPSVASLLPRRGLDAVRVLVFSRSSPGVPDDVGGEHPLRHCAVRRLDPWSEAHDVRLRARHELLRQLHGGRLQLEVIGFITASGGGLTLSELTELTGQPRHLLVGELGSVFGRSLQSRLPSQAPEPDDGERVYLFAHETLRAIAEEQLTGKLGDYRERIDAWADGYRARGWPEGTPRYLLRPYGRLVAASGDLQRLVALATDPARQDRMLAYTQGDAAALAEITAAQQMLFSQPVPDLVSLGRLAVYRDRLANRNRDVPIELPGMWARLGRGQRGEALAQSITSPYVQVQALTGVAEALVETDRGRALLLFADAEQVARAIPSSRDQAAMLAMVVEGLAEAGQWDRAERLAHTITVPEHTTKALTAVAEALVKTGQWERAEQLARHITQPNSGVHALTVVARVLAEVGQWERAQRTAQAITSPQDQARALTLVAERLAQGGHWEPAQRIAPGITTPYGQGAALTAVAKALARAGQFGHAEQVARTITYASSQSYALTAVAETLIAAGRPGALTLLADAEFAARAITDLELRSWALTDIVRALGRAGQWDRAEQAARMIPLRYSQAWALAVVAKALARVDPIRAITLVADLERAAHAITEPRQETWVRANVAVVLARAGQWERAESAARALITWDYHGPDASAVAAALRALVEAGQWDRAMRTIRAIPYTHDQDQVLLAVVEALVEARQSDGAERAARAITDPRRRVRALTEAAKGLIPADPRRALRLVVEVEQAARAIPAPHRVVQMLAVVAEGLAEARQWDRAEQAARAITRPGVQVRALTAVARILMAMDRRRALALLADAARADHDQIGLHAGERLLAEIAEALAEAGQWEVAERAARAISNLHRRIQSLVAIARAMAQADPDQALALFADVERAARGRAWALVTVATALTEVDRGRAIHLSAEAARAARAITDPRDRAQALARVAEALAETGQLEHAEQVARTITDPNSQIDALAAVARGLAETGHGRAPIVLAEAERAARAMTDTIGQTDRLFPVVKALAHAGQWDRAEQAARTITYLESQARALRMIIDALIAASRQEPIKDALLRTRASRLVADVLAGSYWLEALRPLGQLSPSGIVAVHEAVRASAPHQTEDIDV